MRWPGHRGKRSACDRPRAFLEALTGKSSTWPTSICTMPDVTVTPIPVSALLQEARHLHEIGLTDRLIAMATGAEPRTVRGWLSGGSEPSGAHAERLAELAAVTDRLARVVRSEAIPAWPLRPNVALDDARPVDLMARRDYLPVAKVISSIEYPGAS